MAERSYRNPIDELFERQRQRLDNVLLGYVDGLLGQYGRLSMCSNCVLYSEKEPCKASLTRKGKRIPVSASKCIDAIKADMRG